MKIPKKICLFVKTVGRAAFIWKVLVMKNELLIN